jgi:ribosomal protein L31E
MDGTEVTAVKASKRATELTYTEKEQSAITTLRANAGKHLSAKELGIPTAILVSLMKKAVKFPSDPNVVVVNKEPVEDICPTCGAKKTYNRYWVD